MSEYRDGGRAGQLRAEALAEELAAVDATIAEARAEIARLDRQLHRLLSRAGAWRELLRAWPWLQHGVVGLGLLAVVGLFDGTVAVRSAHQRQQEARNQVTALGWKLGRVDAERRRLLATLDRPPQTLADPAMLAAGRQGGTRLEIDEEALGDGNGRVVIATTPPAMALIDGSFYGWTPLGTKLRAGRHTLVLLRDRRMRTERSLRVEAGRTLSVGVELPPQPGEGDGRE